MHAAVPHVNKTINQLHFHGEQNATIHNTDPQSLQTRGSQTVVRVTTEDIEDIAVTTGCMVCILHTAK